VAVILVAQAQAQLAVHHFAGQLLDEARVAAHGQRLRLARIHGDAEGTLHADRREGRRVADLLVRVGGAGKGKGGGKG
jgi:hypothetical protein